ncbi:hypothetical protein Scep_025010 [Stephania cephalantha]|uniref:Uncharacterized protein n=1 Tax=Stephania cephalantha TaxID=152367 RepID=A0AAP0HYZ1_9MAGN
MPFKKVAYFLFLITWKKNWLYPLTCNALFSLIKPTTFLTVFIFLYPFNKSSLFSGIAFLDHSLTSLELIPLVLGLCVSLSKEILLMRWMSHGRSVGGMLLMRKGTSGDQEGRNISNGIEATLPKELYPLSLSRISASLSRV